MRRGEEDRGSRALGQVAELEALVDGSGAVVAGRDDVRVTVDEAGPHPQEAIRLFAVQVELERGSDRAKLAQSARLQLPDPLAGDAEIGADLFERLRGLAVEAEAAREHVAHARASRSRASESSAERRCSAVAVSGRSVFVSSIRSP